MRKTLAIFVLTFAFLLAALQFFTVTTLAVDPPAPPLKKQGEGVPIDIKLLPTNVPQLSTNGATDPVRATESFMLRYIIRPIFFISGGVAVIVIMYAGFQIISARGEEEGITSAKTTLTWAFAGLALVVLAYTIVSNLGKILEGAGLI